MVAPKEKLYSEPELRQLDRLVCQLNRRGTMTRIFLGEDLSWLHTNDGARKLGYPDTATYGFETVQQSKRWCEDSRRLAKRLYLLPKLKQALFDGIISYSALELLVRVATPENEQAVIEAARGKTVRELRALLAAANHKVEDDAVPERSTIQVTLDQTDAWFVESTKMLVAALCDSPSSDEFAEALLAEGATRLIADLADVELPDLTYLENNIAEGRAQMSGSRDAREAEADRARKESEDWAEDAYIDMMGDTSDPLVVDARIRQTADKYRTIDVQLAQLLQALAVENAWGTLGFDSLEHYARERLGMSLSAARSRIALAWDMRELPGLCEALSAKRIGLEAARLIARIARPYNVDAWVERAEQRTLKHLREEVEAADLLARMTNRRKYLAPPDDATLETAFELERAVLAGAIGHSEADAQMSGSVIPLNEPRTTVTLHMREDLGRYWRALERVYLAHSDGKTPFVIFLCRALWDSWRDSEARVASYAYVDVYLRERFRCACPVCSRRDVTAHHVVFRAHGGGEGRDNLAAVCSQCHLEGIHRNTLRVSGSAPDRLIWQLGRVTVDGRVRRAA